MELCLNISLIESDVALMLFMMIALSVDFISGLPNERHEHEYADRGKKNEEEQGAQDAGTSLSAALAIHAHV